VGMHLIIFILFFFVSCSTKIPVRLSRITSEGMKLRTGVSLPSNGTRLPPGVAISERISADVASTIALWNNPQYSTDLANLQISYGDLVDAGQLRNPRLDILAPLGRKPFELLLNFPIEALWERPIRVEAATKAYEQLAHSLIQNGMMVVQDAKIAYANFALAKKREVILKRAVDLRSRIARINMNQRVKDGELTEAEGLSTEVDSASSEELWTRSRHETYISRERFKFVLGLVFESSNIDVEEINSVNLAITPLLTLEEDAFRMRPDLKALELGVHAAAARAGWEKKRLTQLSLLLSSKGIGNYGVLTGPGLSTDLPIFHQNNGLIQRREAEVEWALRQYATLKQRIAFEVREARELLVQAHEVLERTQKNVLPLLQRTVKIAERQYKNRSASYLYVLEQTRSLVDAELRVADFEASVVRAEAVLQRATGGKI
jgi:cobalt-zinc-cadmium efflux system outer membrane protein